jgi:hypothetical protein
MTEPHHCYLCFFMSATATDLQGFIALETMNRT